MQSQPRCRSLADLFNRLHHEKNGMTAGKTFVSRLLKQHRYAIACQRRDMKKRRPQALANNMYWGMDLTYVSDEQGTLHRVLEIIDYGSRRNLCLSYLHSKHSHQIVLTLLKTFYHYGLLKSIKTDNEAVFTSRLITLFLHSLGMKHQTSDPGCPRQNGRVERFIGTFKEKITQMLIVNDGQLRQLLPSFQYWYNAVRPHRHLDGLTPDEVWHRKNVFTHDYKRTYWFNAWDGVLTGYYLTG